MIKTLLTLLLVSLLTASVLGFVFFRLLDPEFLNKQAQKANLYGKLTGNLEQILPTDIEQDGVLTRQDLAEIIPGAISAERFYDFTAQIANSYLSYLTNRSNKVDFNYDLKTIKAATDAKIADRLISRYQNLSTCDQKQLRTFDLANWPTCRLNSSATLENDEEQLIKSKITKLDLLSGIPDQITINSDQSKLGNTKAKVSGALSLIKIIWLSTLVLVLLLFLIYRRKAFFSLAGAFLLVGLITVAFSFIAWDWLARVITELIKSNSNEALLPALTDLITTVIDVLRGATGNISIVTLALGAVFLILGLAWRDRKNALIARTGQ